ncbi:MAG: YbaK family protein [Bacillaceae bacterium]|nr:YbaK family protein [Bacillaceae bacterium]
MNLITTLDDRRRKKQWNFERKVLRKLSLSSIREYVHLQFSAIFDSHVIGKTFIEDCCIDFAIDAYLLGAEFSRFGYFGETELTVMTRCQEEYTDQIDHLYRQLSNLVNKFENENHLRELCDHFIRHWWTIGFKEGEKRYRMRLH